MKGVQAGHRELARVKDAVKAGRLAEVSLGQGDERSLFERLSVSLGLGEASSIAVAKSRRLVSPATIRRRGGRPACSG